MDETTITELGQRFAATEVKVFGEVVVPRMRLDCTPGQFVGFGVSPSAIVPFGFKAGVNWTALHFEVRLGSGSSLYVAAIRVFPPYKDPDKVQSPGLEPGTECAYAQVSCREDPRRAKAAFEQMPQGDSGARQLLSPWNASTFTRASGPDWATTEAFDLLVDAATQAVFSTRDQVADAA